MKKLIFICFFLIVSSSAFSQALEKNQVFVTSTGTFILKDDKSMNDFKVVAEKYFKAYNEAFDGVIKFSYAIGDRGSKKHKIMNIWLMDLTTRDAIWPCEADSESEGCEGNGLYVRIYEENGLAEVDKLFSDMVKTVVWDDETHTDWIVY